MLAWEVHIGKRLINAVFDDLGSSGQFQFLQAISDCLGFLSRSFVVLLRMNGLNMDTSRIIFLGVAENTLR